MINLTIIYSSQTGTVKSFACRLASQLQSFYQNDRNPSVELISCDKFRPISRLITLRGLLIFITSTTGDGHYPDSLVSFWKSIMHKDLPLFESLPNLEFIMIGFGDSNYRKFNEVAKKLYNRFKLLGAVPKLLSPELDSALFLMDDSAPGGIMEGIYDFTTHFFRFLNIFLSYDSEFSSSQIESLEFISSILNKNDMKISFNSTDEVYSYSFKPTDYYKISLKSSKRVTPDDHFQDTRIIEFQIPTEVSYNSGDVLFIQPTNCVKDVDYFFKLTYNDPSQIINVSSCSEFPEGLNCLAYDLILNYFDLNSTPNQFFFLDFASLHVQQRFIESSNQLENEKNRLLEFGRSRTIEDVDDLYSYTTRMKRTLLEVLQDFPLTASLLNPESWFKVLPGPIRPRAYSLCNTQDENPTILVAIVDYKTTMRDRRKGICSYYLKNLKPGQEIIGKICRTSCSLDFNAHFNVGIINKPVIMIGPGTCVSPFRSFLLHQEKLECKLSQPNILIFGCRSKMKDEYFSQDWNDLILKKKLVLFNALSRDPSTNKTYVQDIVETQSKLMWKYISVFEATIMIVANNSKMSISTRNAFIKVIMQESSEYNDISIAEEYLDSLMASKRFQIEAWS